MISYNGVHPVGILEIGCGRQCKHSRSEAIMSVLGCTDWHKAALEARKQQGMLLSYDKPSLVLGQYTYEFLDEIRQKYGFVFFSSSHKVTNFFFLARDQEAPVGSILPFSPRIIELVLEQKEISEAKMLASSQPHPSIKTWELLRDGSVKIVDEGIIYAAPKDIPVMNADSLPKRKQISSPEE